MTTHTMTRDAHAGGIQLGERSKDGLGKFFGDVTVHVVAIIVGRLCGVDVEACSAAEVVGVILAGDV